MSACQKKWWAPFQLGCETAEVVYMSSSLLQLSSGSRDLSQAEKIITVKCKAEQIRKMTLKLVLNYKSHFE